MSSSRPPVVVAVGGNALIRRGERGTADEQMSRASDCMSHVAGLIGRGERVVITHGNGPFVGNIMIQMECARADVPVMPLFIADADSEGGIGFMLQQALYNRLGRPLREQGVVAVVTQVVVDAGDPAFARPTKPVGPFYNARDAQALKAERGWEMAEDADRGWRRVVPSPRPLRIVEAPAIRRMAETGIVVIAAGGGGVPVVEKQDGTLAGVDAVVDKDLASAVLALETGAARMIILTSVDAVYLDYGKAGQRPIKKMGMAEAEGYIADGQFPPGSMGPKVEAAVLFLRGGGGEALITSPERLDDALSGSAGTLVTGQ